jgi:hypothetical protein
MRKFLISLLLASAAASPALAAPRDSSDRQQAREDRQSAREDRQSAREERQSAREDRQSAREDRQPARAQRVQVREQRANNFIAPQNRGPAQVDVRSQAVDRNAYREQRRDARQDARAQRLEQRQDASDYVAPGPRVVNAPRAQLRDQRIQQREVRQQDMRDRRDLRRSARPTPIVSNTPRPGTQPPLRAEHRRGGEHRWDGSWRNNHRYDWQNHRRHHRSLFHLGFYFDPYGWGYQPYSIGWRLWPSYYSSRYWINDPWMYRLPYAPPGYAWVRSWNDAMLVDTWTGTVVDVIPGFFW